MGLQPAPKGKKMSDAKSARTWTAFEIADAYSPCGNALLNDEHAFIEYSPAVRRAVEMHEELIEALKYAKGTLEQVIPMHTENGAWELCEELLKRAVRE